MNSININQIIFIMCNIINGDADNIDDHLFDIAEKSITYIDNLISDYNDITTNDNIKYNQINSVYKSNSENHDQEYVYETKPIPKLRMTYKDIFKIANYMKINPNHKFNTVKHKYCKCDSIELFYKIKSFVKNNFNGFNNYKSQEIKDYLRNFFHEKRKRFHKISDEILMLIQFKKHVN